MHRGFHVSSELKMTHLDEIGTIFLKGCLLAMREPKIPNLCTYLDDERSEYRGFAYEGAALSLAIKDIVFPWNMSRWGNLLNSSQGDKHVYMLHVGRGWAVAKLPWRRMRLKNILNTLDPILCWLVVDGIGFHDGFFRTTKTLQQKVIPNLNPPYANRVYDQGVGRSLWFSCGASPTMVRSVLESFPKKRHADLWSGIGLAATYAGGCCEDELIIIKECAGAYRSHLAQGAAFAAKARLRAGNPSRNTELACRVFCGVSPDAAARATDIALENLYTDSNEPLYEAWRARIRKQFSQQEAFA